MLEPSALRKRWNGSTASFTATGALRGVVAPSPVAASTPSLAKLGDAGAQHDSGARLGQRHRGGLGHERHGAAGPRIGLQHVEHVVLERVLHVEQADHADAVGDGLGGPAHRLDVAAAQRHRRQRTRRVAGVDAGLLDVLHDPADVHLGAVAQRVDVDLDGVLEEPVDEHRVLGRQFGGAGDVALQGVLVVHDLHAAPAQHVGRPHQHRIADLGGDAAGLLEAGGGAELRRGQAGGVQHFAERAAVLGQVDGLRAGARRSARPPSPAARPGPAASGRRAAR